MPNYDMATITLAQLTDLIQDACSIYQNRGGNNMDDVLEQTPLREMFGSAYEALRDTIDSGVMESEGKSIRFLMDDFDNTLAELDDVATDYNLKRDIESFLYDSPLANEVRLEQMYKDSCGMAQSLFKLMDREPTEEDKAFIAQQEQQKEPSEAVQEMEVYKSFASLVVTTTAVALTEDKKEFLSEPDIKTFLDNVQKHKDNTAAIRTVEVAEVEKVKETPQIDELQKAVEPERVKISMETLKAKLEEPKPTLDQDLENRMNSFISKSLTKDELARADKRGMNAFDLLSINGVPLSDNTKWPTHEDKLKAMDEQLNAKKCIDVCHVSKNGKSINTTSNYLVTPEDKTFKRENYSTFRLWLHDKGLFKINGFEDKMRELSEEIGFELKTRTRQRAAERQVRDKIHSYEDKINPITPSARERRNAQDEQMDKREEKEVQDRYDKRSEFESDKREKEWQILMPQKSSRAMNKHINEMNKLMEKDAAKFEKEAKEQKARERLEDQGISDPKRQDKIMKQERETEKRAAKEFEKQVKLDKMYTEKAQKLIAAFNKKQQKEREAAEKKQLKLKLEQAKAKGAGKAK